MRAQLLSGDQGAWSVVDAEIISAGWATASGVGLALLAGFVLSGGATRSRGAMPFGLFVLAWAMSIVAVNIAPQFPGYARYLYVFTVGMLLVIPYLLIEFAASFASGGPRDLGWMGARWSLGALAVIGALVVAFRPGVFLESTLLTGGLVYPTWTIWKVVVDLVGIVAFGVTLLILYVSLRNAPTARTKNRLLIFVTGFGIYVGYSSGNYLVRNLSHASWSFLDPSMLYVVGFFASWALVIALGGHALRAFTEAHVEEDRRREMFIAASLLFPLGWAMAEALLVSSFFQSVGLWRLVSVAIIAYGMARWRIYDLPDRVRRAAASSTGFAGALAGGAVVFGLTSGFGGGPLVALLGGVAVTSASAGPSMRFSRRWLGPSYGDDPGAREKHRFARKVDAYRAAVETSIARGTREEDEAFLRALQEDFGIDPREARVIEHYARDAVIPVKEGDAGDAYDRIRILGQGGAGQTWLARDRARDRLVVLKEPLKRWHTSDAMIEAARSEARLAAKVRHPNVVEVEEVIEDDGVPILVMEYVSGGSLGEILRDEGALEWPRAVKLVADVAWGLSAVHQAGILHRDVKPSNVLVTEDGMAKVSDFGIARKEEDGGTRVLEGQAPAGTSGFMAPEVERGTSRGSEAADVYGCAALLHSLLTGEQPDRWSPLPDRIPEDVKDLLQRGLDPDPEMRFASAEALARALEELSVA